jgi:HlyD family secretion protein
VVNYTTVVSVNNADLKLRPGMTANASIITAQRSGVLRIPNAALRFRPPESAVIKGATNAPGRGTTSTNRNAFTKSDGTNSAPFSSSGDGPRPSREEIRQRFESMTPEQREQFRATMRARAGDGGSGGMGSGFRSRDEGPGTRTIYVVDKEAAGKSGQTVLKPATIKTGISDGTFTEVVEGLEEGDVVVSGLNTPATAAATSPPGGSPFGGPFGGGRIRR